MKTKAPIDVYVGEASTRAIEAAGLSRVSVAKQVGMSPYRLRRRLRGEVSFNVDDFMALSEAVQADPVTLLPNH